MSNVNWKAYYQREAEIKRFVPEEDPDETDRVSLAVSLLPKNINSTLDIGCGDGYLCSVFKKQGIKTVAGIDISKKRIKYAEQKFKGIEFRVGDFDNLPFENNSFEMVSLIEVLEHSENPDRTLYEARRVSQEYVMITVPSEQRIKEMLCPHCFGTFPPDGHLHSFNRDFLESVCRRNRLDVVEFSSFSRKNMWEVSILFRHMPPVVIRRVGYILSKFGISKKTAKYIGVLCRSV